MKIINARLRRQEALFTLDLQDGMIHRITAQAAMQTADAGDIDAQGRLAIPPFVEPHIHLDATLTAGEPEWNRSGTLFEGITRWSQRKASITPEDTRQRALKTIGMLRDFGVQHVRTHVDVTDPSLAALQAQKQYTFMKSEFIFSDPKTGEPWANADAIRKKAWVPTLKKAGVRYRNPYQTRHTFATRHISRGVNLFWLSGQMGHKGPEMLFRHYGTYLAEYAGRTVVRGKTEIVNTY